ncbi:MAG: flavodoxin domain-containing protein [Xanthomonadaceae bacterium]|nr:flavodoxin domain-containing protein [Xanthomonadaceae bacterium]
MRYQTAPHSDKLIIIDRKIALFTGSGIFLSQSASPQQNTQPRQSIPPILFFLYRTLKMKLKILVGSMTHTAKHVAQAIQMECADLANPVEVEPMDGLDISVFDADKTEDVLYLICTSTYGAGDVPDNAQALYQSLDLQPRFLGHVRYGVIALGDSASHAQTFCFGGKHFDERLQDLGAQRIGEICCLDSSDGTLPETVGAEWCRQWLQAALPKSSAPCDAT